jgi:CMP-N-acetylneuraminic acid synthetase
MPETVLHVAGLILARGGSQGIPLKNITKLSTHPLLVWSLGAMKAFGRFDSVWVSTDHGLIAACASSMGASVFHRSPRYAKCGTPSVDAVQEFLFNHPEVDIVGLVQCTSPFLQPEFLEKAYNLITEEGYDSVFSVTRDKKLRWSEADFTNDVKEFSETMKSRKSDSSNKKISIIQANQQLPSNTCTQNGAKTTVITTKNGYTMTNGLSKQNSNRDKTTSYSSVPLQASSVSSSNPTSTSTTTKEAVTKQNDNEEVVIPKNPSSNHQSRVTMRDSRESLEDAKSSFPNKLIKVEVSPSLRNHSKESRIEAKEAGKEVVVLNGCRNNGHTLEDATNGEEDSDSISPSQDLSCCFSR